MLDSGEVEPLARETLPMERGHAEALLPLIARVIGAVDGGFDGITRVAATVGPGSFTGIRIGLAAAQGIAIARKIELVGVSTLAALAAPHILEPFEGVVAAVIDARNGQVYVTAYGPDGRSVLPARRMGAHEARRALGDGPLRLVGSGAALLEPEAPPAASKRSYLDTAATADIVSSRGSGLSPTSPRLPRVPSISRRRTPSRSSGRARAPRRCPRERFAMSLIKGFFAKPTFSARPIKADRAEECERLHAASFAFPWSSSDFESYLTDSAILADGAVNDTAPNGPLGGPISRD